MDAAAVDLSAIEPVRADAREILGQYESILLYGIGGTGKTFTAATAPEPQWWLTVGGTRELKTAFSPAFVKKHGRKEMFVSSVVEDRERGQMTDNPSGYDRCCDSVDSFLEWNDREGIGTKTIVVDNATVLEEYIMNKAIMAEYVLAGSKDKTTLSNERQLGIRKPHKGTWGGAMSLMDQWVNWLVELPFHLVFVAHTHEVYKAPDNQGGSPTLETVSPLFVGQQRTSVPNKFDNVWYSTVGGGGRSRNWGIQTEGDAKIQAKTRVGGLLDPSYERDPNLTDIIEQFSQYAHSIEEE